MAVAVGSVSGVPLELATVICEAGRAQQVGEGLASSWGALPAERRPIGQHPEPIITAARRARPVPFVAVALEAGAGSAPFFGCGPLAAPCWR